jgi:hypothetical protein
MGAAEVEAFLSWLRQSPRRLGVDPQAGAVGFGVSLQAGPGADLPWLQEISRPRTPQRLPVVMSRAEVQQLLTATTGEHQLVFRLMYGTGMLKMESSRSPPGRS